MTKSFSNILALAMLALMFILLFASAWNDSAIMDELAHIPAGYSYLKLRDLRLNPEHPPLIKDLAAFPLLFLNPNFPTNTSYWSNDVNGQWAQGAVFLYEAGNNPDKILHWSRFPIMLLAVFFGWLLFWWTRSVYGEKTALLTLFFFVLSPTFLAHSRYVTTDLAAAFGFFIGLVAFVRFLEKEDFKRFFIAGLAFGIALLLKFSLFLLLPIQFILLVLWVWARGEKKFKSFLIFFAKLLAIWLLGFLLVWAVYAWHVWNYPLEREFRDAEFLLSSFGIKPLANLDLWLIQDRFFRPLGQYILGLLMAVQRSAGGNTTYYLGEVSAAGWRSYFPAAYLLKETLPFHLLTLLALFLAVNKAFRSKKRNWDSFWSWVRNNFHLASILIFIAVYWFYSVKSPLNIGIRHVLPTFPFIYLLVSREIVGWLGHRSWLRLLPAAFLGLWLATSVLAASPFYLSYYNELVGRSEGYRFIVDSNYDWGQDLKRLRDWAERENISRVYLDYFGGGSPRYYLGVRFIPWSSAKGPPPADSYFAVSATLLQGAQGKPVQGFQIKPGDSYSWLKGLEPVKRAGTSIFIYRF